MATRYMAMLMLVLSAGCSGGGSGGDDSANLAPSAVAGENQSVETATTVQLDGGLSWDGDGDALSYNWWFIELPIGSAATLSDSAAVTPTFVPDRGGRYKLGLIVSDGLAASFQDSVTIYASSAPPVADAGADQGVAVGARVQLNGGSSSDVDGNPLTYSWTLTSAPAGSNAALSNAQVAYPSFTADLAGSYVLELVVADGISGNSTDSVTVYASHAPSAAAGPDQGVATNAPVTLDGSASSDPDGDPLNYTWSFVSTPGGVQPTPFDATATQPSFTPPYDGDYLLALTVNDGTLDSLVDTVTISASSSPVANAGPDKTYTSGALITLDSSSSYDPDNPAIPDDGTITAYSWSFVADPSGGANLSDATAASPSFTPALDGDYMLQLIVNDGVSNSAPDTVTIRVLTPPVEPLAPLADTGQDLCYDTAGSEIACAGTGQDGDVMTTPIDMTLNPGGTVNDNVTGLTWQHCSNGQGGALCDDTPATLYNGYQALGIYDPALNPVSTDVCGDLELGGYDDWRLPSALELMQILDYGELFPVVNPAYFPNTVPYYYWSSTCIGSPSCSTAYWVDFGYAQYVHYGWGNNFEEEFPVRCVRGDSITPFFADNGDGTVSDLNTGRDWQRNDGGTMTWQQGLDYCAGLGTGWRLPDIKELASAVAAEDYLPYNGLYWSSTNIGDLASVAGVDFFGLPSAFTTGKSSDTVYTRCVR